MTRSNNQTETVKVEGGTVTFDHANGTMFAVWDNGYTETWKRRGCSMSAKRNSFYRFTDQWHRLQYDKSGCEV